MPLVASQNLKVNSYCWGCSGLWRQDPESSSLWSRYHSTGKWWADCQDRKAINSPAQLRHLWATAMTNMARYPQRCTSGPYMLVVTNSCLVVLMDHLRGQNSCQLMSTTCGWWAHRTYNLWQHSQYLFLYPQIKVAFIPHKEAFFFFFPGDRDYYRKPQLLKMQRTFNWVLSPNWYICTTALIFMTQETSRTKQVWGFQCHKGPRCLLWDYILYIWHGSWTCEISTLWLHKQDLSNDNTSWHANNGGDLTRPHP